MQEKKREAYYLAQDYEYGRTWSPGPPSAWWYDGRGARKLERNYGPYSLSNEKGEAPTGFIRELRKTSEGKITVLAAICIESGFDGLFIELYDSDKNDAAFMYTKDGKYYALGKNQKDILISDEKEPSGWHTYKIELDFDTKKASYYVDDEYKATVPLAAKHIKYYKIGTFEGKPLQMKLGETHIHANYPLNEKFSFYNEKNPPSSWVSEGNVAVKCGNLSISAAKGKVSTFSKTFDAQTGKVCFESFFFMPKIKSGAKVELLSGGKSVLEFYTEGKSFAANGKTLKNARDELWYRLRFELDTEKNSTLVKINGKPFGTFKFLHKASFIDGVRYTVAPSEKAELLIDYVKLFPIIEYEDYCPKPVVPKGMNDYVVGMNMCSLWHTGAHIGWDVISAYPDHRPVIGYYDEGLPEVADWEIKFMLENGVDFQLYCWFASQTNAPFKTTHHSQALIDGYFNCKYSEMTHFALLWEAQNACHPASSEVFRKYFVPYWIEYFFSDKRYMTIDNKAIMAVFGPGQLLKDFGGPEGVKRELDYLKSEVKKLGYDDLIIMGCGVPNEDFRDCGFDAAYAYGWGKKGCDVDYTMYMMRKEQDMNLVNIVPTACTGYNNVAWAETKSPNMTVPDFRTLNTIYRDDILKTYQKEGKPKWMQKFVMLSNWNEYGEGTYLMPCEKLNGFGYLNTIRDIYTKEKGEYTNLTPTQNQLSRLSYLYPQERRMIRVQGDYVSPYPDKLIKSFKFTAKDFDEKWTCEQMSAKATSKSVKGITEGEDPKITLKGSCKVSSKGLTHVRVNAKVNKMSELEVFYITESAPEWSQYQSFQITLTPDKTSGLCKVGNQPNLDSPIIGVRVDPSKDKDVEFELFSVDFMSDTAEPVMYVDGVSHPINSPVVVKDGYTLYPFNPYYVLLSRIGAYYEYNAPTKELSFYSKSGSVVFTIGTRNAVINGEKKLLNTAVELFDGLPMLPLEIMSEVLGFDFKYKAPRLDIYTK